MIVLSVSFSSFSSNGSSSPKMVYEKYFRFLW